MSTITENQAQTSPAALPKRIQHYIDGGQSIDSVSGETVGVLTRLGQYLRRAGRRQEEDI